jgi:hypothetical protein
MLLMLIHSWNQLDTQKLSFFHKHENGRWLWRMKWNPCRMTHGILYIYHLDLPTSFVNGFTSWS